MERISIFNYEAFYLDYLEGNLNEVDAAVLLDFLSNNPELQVNLDDMPVFSEDEDYINIPSFENLKQVDYDLASINMSNIETFAIAFSEKQLSTEKESELLSFMNENKEAKAVVVSYQKIKLLPDAQIVYDGKSNLKQQQKIVIWQYAAIAASIIGFVFAFQVWMNLETSESQQIYAFEQLKGRMNKENNRIILSGNSTVNTASNEDSNRSEINTTKAYSNQSNQPLTAKDNRLVTKNDDILFAYLSKRTPELNHQQMKDGILIIEHPIVPINNAPEEPNPNSSMTYNNMANPIKPITNRLSDFTKTEIDVRTAKATDEKKAGFFLKIGKLEIERPSR